MPIRKTQYNKFNTQWPEELGRLAERRRYERARGLDELRKVNGNLMLSKKADANNDSPNANNQPSAKHSAESNSITKTYNESKQNTPFVPDPRFYEKSQQAHVDYARRTVRDIYNEYAEVEGVVIKPLDSKLRKIDADGIGDYQE